jgi:four helix bundle protein
MDTSMFQFAHHKLDAYRVARQLADRVKGVADRVPRGYRSHADQLLRAAGNTVGLIGEGANRFSPGQKRQRFIEARGECGEVACWVELLHGFGFVAEVEAQAVLELANRVCAMLTGLIKRHS